MYPWNLLAEKISKENNLKWKTYYRRILLDQIDEETNYLKTLKNATDTAIKTAQWKYNMD